MGASVGHVTPGASSDNVIEGNWVYRNGLMNEGGTMNGGWPAAIAVSLSDRTIVRANSSFHNYGEGIGCLSSVGVEMANNASYDNFSVLIYLDNCQRAVVRSNFAFIAGDTRFYRKNTPAVGIAVANESTAVLLPSSGIRIFNNIMVGTRFGFEYGNYQRGGGMQDVLIANNTVVNAVEAAIKIDPDQHRGNRVLNNIFYRARFGPLELGSSTGTWFDNNCWFGGNPGLFTGQSDVWDDPLLVQPGALSSDAYRLRDGSPCASSGRVLSEVPSDFSGATRTDRYSSGAYEKESAPAGPTNLRVTP